MKNTMVKQFKALGEETRMKIVRCLLSTERCACEFDTITGRDQTTVSRHLKVLVEADILRSERDGRRIMYSIIDEETRNWLRGMGIEPLNVCCEE